jgi:AcrR family transcriptional regulator
MTDLEFGMKKVQQPTGLRARKREETLARITQEALRLFVKRGFEAVTLDEIAQAAGISRRTFFHYFASKEDLAFAWLDASTGAMVAAVADRPAGEPPLAMALHAILACMTPMPRAQAFALARLINETPVLRDRSQSKYGRLETALAGAIAARQGLKKDDLKVRLAAMTAAGTLRVASQRWYESGGSEDLAVFARRVVKAVMA